MPKGILGRKVGMTQLVTSGGKIVPVTIVEAGPCYVTQKKTIATDGYNAIQIGFGDKREHLMTKPVQGHLKKAGVKPLRYIRELRTKKVDDYELGQEIKVDIFTPGERVDVMGTSKGHGFSGVLKRHGFHRGPMSHGSKHHRKPGALAAKGVAKVFRGTKLPGHYGVDRVTAQNLEVIKVDKEHNVIAIKGSIPGPRGSMVFVKDAVKFPNKVAENK
ncbi:MAG TPA: 50S ribosomal protein L3 [Clostridia bacterium]|nr:50S ribosomal protein L3 [Clostridia bacterium]